MKSPKKCVLIKSPSIAALYSGCDVWMIPYDLETMKMNLKKAYVWDDWSIVNNEIIGINGEQCFIAVEPDAKLGWGVSDKKMRELWGISHE